MDEELEDAADEVKDAAEKLEEAADKLEAAAEEVEEIETVDSESDAENVIGLAIETGKNSAEIDAVQEELKKREESDKWLRNELAEMKESIKAQWEALDRMRMDLSTPPSPPESSQAEVIVEVPVETANTDSEKMEPPQKSEEENPVQAVGEAAAEILNEPLIRFL